MLGQHAGLLPPEQLLLQHNSQIPVSISTPQGVANIAIPTQSMHLEQQQQNQQDNQQVQVNQQSQQQMNHQQQMNSQHPSNNQQNIVQVQVQDNMVSVIDDGQKEHIQKQEIINNQQEQQHQMQQQINNENQQMNQQQSLTVQQLQHLQVQQVLDNVVRMETNDNQQDNQQDQGMNDNIQIVKDEKGTIFFVSLIKTLPSLYSLRLLNRV